MSTDINPGPKAGVPACCREPLVCAAPKRAHTLSGERYRPNQHQGTWRQFNATASESEAILCPSPVEFTSLGVALKLSGETLFIPLAHSLRSSPRLQSIAPVDICCKNLEHPWQGRCRDETLANIFPCMGLLCRFTVTPLSPHGQQC